MLYANVLLALATAGTASAAVSPASLFARQIDASNIPPECIPTCLPNAAPLLACQAALPTSNYIDVCRPLCSVLDAALDCINCIPQVKQYAGQLKEGCAADAAGQPIPPVDGGSGGNSEPPKEEPTKEEPPKETPTDTKPTDGDETKPTDAAPTDAKPTDAKPTDAAPAPGPTTAPAPGGDKIVTTTCATAGGCHTITVDKPKAGGPAPAPTDKADDKPAEPAASDAAAAAAAAANKEGKNSGAGLTAGISTVALFIGGAVAALF